jgi:hypothetical protein
MYPNEEEVLLNRGVIFEVLSVTPPPASSSNHAPTLVVIRAVPNEENVKH